MSVNKGDWNIFFIIWIKMLKHVHMDWKLQEALKSSASFILKEAHFHVIDSFHASCWSAFIKGAFCYRKRVPLNEAYKSEFEKSLK